MLFCQEILTFRMRCAGNSSVNGRGSGSGSSSRGLEGRQGLSYRLTAVGDAGEDSCHRYRH